MHTHTHIHTHKASASLTEQACSHFLSTTAVLNYNAIDADQRDIVTNMRIMLPGRMMAHNKSREFCRPIDVGVNAGDESVQQALQSVVKSRERLSDPRLLSYTDVLHPMVMMRQRTAGDFMDFITWEYYTATLPEITFPPFRWDAQLHFNVTFKIKTDHVLQAAQLYNMMKVQARPKMTYNQLIDDNRKQVWRVFASLGTDVRAYEIERVPPGSGMGSKHSRDSDKFRVKHPSKVLIETRFEAMDVPATFVQTDVSAPDYNGEQPVIKEIEDENKTKKRCDKYFNELPECRDTVYVPRIHGLRVLEFAQIFEGKWSEARAVLSSPPTVQLAVEIRDLSQPRPYAPKFFDFGRPFFTGFALLISAVLILFLWMVRARVHARSCFCVPTL